MLCLPWCLVRKFANCYVTIAQIKGNVFKDKNCFRQKQFFLGFLLHSKLSELLDEGGISERDFDIFYKSALEFYRIAFIYASNNFPLQEEFLQHTRFVNFYYQKCTSQIVLFVAVKLKLCINFSN